MVSQQPVFRASGAGFRTPRIALLPQALVVLGMLLTATFLGLYVSRQQTVRIALLVGAATLVTSLALHSYRALFLASAVWLGALGSVRRMFAIRGLLPDIDPLFLVGQVIVVVLLLIAIRRGALERRTTMAKAVLAMCVLALLSSLNPLQGGPAVGVPGLLFFLMPMLWFWVGRALVDDRTMARYLAIVAGFAVFASGYGLSQTYFGFTWYDGAWAERSVRVGYNALIVEGHIRAFGTFASAAEYAVYLGIGLVLWLAIALRGLRIALLLPVLAFLGFAILLSSVRSVTVLCVVALGMMLAARAAVRMPVALAAGALAIVGLGFAAQGAAGVTFSDSRTAGLLQHQVDGLSDPTNEETSTLGAHMELMTGGFVQAARTPLGLGAGAVTHASARIIGKSRSTEVDPSNVAVGLGFPGLALYLVIAYCGMTTAYAVTRRRRDWLALAGLGILVMTSLQWFNGGHYAVTPMAWLLFGWYDRKSIEIADADAAAPAVGPEPPRSLRRHRRQPNQGVRGQVTARNTTLTRGDGEGLWT